MTKLKNSNWEETQIKLWKSSKTKIVHKLWQKLETHIVTKLKTSNCYKTQKNKLWQNSNQIVTKLKNSNCAQGGTKLKNSNWDKTQLKLWQKTQILLNSKTQIVTVVIVTLVTVAVVTVVIVTSLRKDLTPWQQMKRSRCSFSPFSRCLHWCYSYEIWVGPDC